MYLLSSIHASLFPFAQTRSGEFHTYRAHRRREMHRVAAMDEEAKTEEATAKLQAAIEQVRVCVVSRGGLLRGGWCRSAGSR